MTSLQPHFCRHPIEDQPMAIRRILKHACIAILSGMLCVTTQASHGSDAPSSASGVPSGQPMLLSVKHMRDDLAFMREKIRLQHSNPYLYTHAKTFDQLYRELDRGLDRPLDRLEFYRRAARLAASLKDGHTLVDLQIDDFEAFAKTHGVFPLPVSFINGRLYVAADESDAAKPPPHESRIKEIKPEAIKPNAIKPGVEITAINGKSTSAIVDDYRGLINDVHPIYDVYARLFRELYWLRYGAVPTFTIAYRNNDGSTGTATMASRLFPPGAFHSYQPEGTAYKFEMLPSHRAGLLTINSFSPSDGFDAFLDQSFATLQQNNAGALIIDIRKNGGGSGRLAQQVVSYLTDRPYKLIGAFYVKVTDDLKTLYRQATTHTDEDTRKIVMSHPSGELVDGLKDSGPVVITPVHRDHVFHGDVYLLTANNTFSAAAMFAAYVKCNRLGTVVGEEPGQATNFVADAVPFTMPNSKLTFEVSFSEIHMPCEQSYVHGIRPDDPVTPTPEQLASGKDAALDYTLKLIEQRQRP